MPGSAQRSGRHRRKGFEESYMVRTDRFMNRKSDGAFMEPGATPCHFRSVRQPHALDLDPGLALRPAGVAMVMEMPLEKVRVIAPAVGGGFGVKASACPHEIITCMLARTPGKPVRLVLDRARSIHGEPGAPPVLSRDEDRGEPRRQDTGP